ncbi:SDR family oxidoreductase [Pseudomonas sp. NFR16]|uniref:SDR family oxidoreductase n=1 Tax=Pseudomonas sp. NFR16 TaxID=1566248 RepID=UPI0008B1C298|nr:SDR family oxidoreductase [Pseudomonas sp. NFR16]SEI45317.1 NADP-dependent 3-hydroxy acid dehydrogenase YdfG [Pseudomonas sp. NFR16]
MPHWTLADLPPQAGRIAIVTGTGGLGFEAARALTQAGADVILAGRNSSKGAAAVARIRQQLPQARIRFEELDLANLASVAAFAVRMEADLDRLDLLINNAAVMNPPRRELSHDGLELQFATNYLGHFALTAHLSALLRKAREPRVVTVSSIAARSGRIDLDDLQAERAYRPMSVYSQSKLACLMFMLELQRRSDANGWGLASLAAHPGVSRTDLLLNGAGRWSPAGLLRTCLWFLFQPAAQGVLPTLYAVASPHSSGGSYYGPTRLGETRGAPGPASLPSQALDSVTAARLWAESERLAGVQFQ